MTQAHTVLVVDDEKINRTVIGGFLAAMGYTVIHASSGPEALTKLGRNVDLVLLDILMPGMDGFGVLRSIRSGSIAPDVPVIMITAFSSSEDRTKGMEAGVNDFIAKPIDRTELEVRVRSMLRMKAAQDKLRDYEQDMDERVRTRTRSLELSVENLRELHRSTKEAHLDTIHCLAHAAEYKDEETASHIRRMSQVSTFLGGKYGLNDMELELLRSASPMHDVGKIGIPDAILLKPGKLSGSEWDIMKEHTTIGHRILGSSKSELLQAGATIALTHHEKWDGSGYPRKLKGVQIPLYGRICAVADVFDALISKRPYKAAMSFNQALDIMRQGRGSHFDPDILDIFINHFDEIVGCVQGDMD